MVRGAMRITPQATANAAPLVCGGCGHMVSSVHNLLAKSWQHLPLHDLQSLTDEQRKSKYCASCSQKIRRGRLPCKLLSGVAQVATVREGTLIAADLEDLQASSHCKRLKVTPATNQSVGVIDNSFFAHADHETSNMILSTAEPGMVHILDNGPGPVKSLPPKKPQKKEADIDTTTLCSGCGHAVATLHSLYAKSWQHLPVHDLQLLTDVQRNSKYCSSCSQKIRRGRLPCKLQYDLAAIIAQSLTAAVDEEENIASIVKLTLADMVTAVADREDPGCKAMVKAQTEFQCKIQESPTTPCQSCHQLWFQSTMKQTQLHHMQIAVKKVAASICNNMADMEEELCNNIMQHTQSLRDRVLNCNNCHEALRKGRASVALQICMAYGLPQCPAPLTGLNDMEQRLVALRIPFMQLVRLRIQQQWKIKGSVLNVPNRLDKVATILPRTNVGMHTMLINFKRRMGDSHNYQQQVIDPHRVFEALQYLVTTPLYRKYSAEFVNGAWECLLQELQAIDGQGGQTQCLLPSTGSI